MAAAAAAAAAAAMAAVSVAAAAAAIKAAAAQIVVVAAAAAATKVAAAAAVGGIDARPPQRIYKQPDSHAEGRAFSFVQPPLFQTVASLLVSKPEKNPLQTSAHRLHPRSRKQATIPQVRELLFTPQFAYAIT
jgi:hypothetical protein